MRTLRKIPPVQFLFLVIAFVLNVVAAKHAHAQDPGAFALWQDIDIGVAPYPGGMQADGVGSYVLTSSGGDIWNKADSFNFFYEPIDGDGEIVAHVQGMQGTAVYAKAGVMVRESLAANARHAMMLTTLSRGDYFQWRTGTGQDADQIIDNTNCPVSCWVKLARHGDWVGGYMSLDGSNWKLVEWQTISGLASQVYVGLALANHGGGTSSATFDQISVNPINMADVLYPYIGSGDGLSGSYFENRHLFGEPAIIRVDPKLDWQWQGPREWAGTVMDGWSKPHEFGVRWTGELQAQFTEPYTLSVQSDDGVRVWLNEKLIINDWFSHTNREDSALVNLVAGQKYLVRIEYFQNRGDLTMKLLWSSPSTPERIIPQSQLYSLPTDSDTNGLPDLWEQHYFGGIGVDPEADPDGDGLSNLEEWRRHSNPLDSLNWGVPNEWGHGDIERWDSSDGAANFEGGLFTVTSAGEDIYKEADNFHYVYQSIGTNGEIIARLLGINGTNSEAKAGVMVRESLDNDARNAMMYGTRGNYISWQMRMGKRWNTFNDLLNTNQLQYNWFKLVRYNDFIGGYLSVDGTNWSLYDWQSFRKYSPQAFIGLAVTAHNLHSETNPVTGRFDQVNIAPVNPSDVIMSGDGDGLLGSYRNDSLLYLPGLTNRIDEEVNFWWVHEPPMQLINADSYGVSWSGEVQAQFSEPYTFSLDCRREDWARVWINEKLIIDGWRTWHRDGTLRSPAMDLVAGQHYLIRVEMFNNHGRGAAALNWSSPSTTRRIISQSQLYSHPTDADGNGLPDIWEQIYFGHTGVDPAADPDGDGLSNLQEYQNHTSPVKADTDGDGIPDAWEIAHGLDPQFDDASLDYDNSGWSNLQKFLYGLDPFNLDVNGDGLPDAFEVQYLGTDAITSHAGESSVAALLYGAQATNYLGNWQVEGNDIYCLDRRGGVDFNLTVGNADKYILTINGTQDKPNPFETRLKLALTIDGQSLGHRFLNTGYGTNGQVMLVLPYLQAGAHTLQVFWDGAASYSSLRIHQIELLSVSGADANHNGIKDWMELMLANESGMNDTNPVIYTYTSPACLEGRDPYPVFMKLTNNVTNALSPIATTDSRWYVDVPLSGTQAVVQASYQNAAFMESRTLRWQQINLLNATNRMTVRQGDSLWLTALPAGSTNGGLQVAYGTNVLTGKAAKGVICKFTSPGVYTVTGTFTASSGSVQSGSITVEVVHQGLPNIKIDAWTGMQRVLNLPSLDSNAVLQADSRLNCFIKGTNDTGGVQLALGVDANEERTILARLGTNGPVLDSTRVTGYDEWCANQTYTRVVLVYPDGSQLVETLIVSSPVEPDVTFVLEPIVSGVIFEDGTIVKTLTASDFDALGQCPVRFIRPASARTSVCHSIRAFQGNYLLGYQH